VNDTHYLKVFVRRLRQKSGDDAEHPRYIQTEWLSATAFFRHDHDDGVVSPQRASLIAAIPSRELY